MVFKPPRLGVGIVYNAFLLDFIRRDPGLVDFVEVEPETLWAQLAPGQRSFRLIGAEFDDLLTLPMPKLLHSIGFPVGGSCPPSFEHLALLNAMSDALRCPWISEHLSFNTAVIDGQIVGTGMLLPQLQTAEGVAHAVRTTRAYAAEINRPVAIETGVNYLKPHAFEMSDGSFIRQVAEGADCGILLDLHNVWTNELNGRQNVLDLVAELPLDRVWEVHVAGGEARNGYWIDSHCGLVPEQLLKLASQVIPHLPNLGAITLEVFPAYLPKVMSEGLGAEIDTLREMLAAAPSGLVLPRRSPPPSPPGLPAGPAPRVAEWEQALAEGMLQYPPTTEIGRQMRTEPALPLYNELLGEFRASMVGTAFGLTTRLLLLHLGKQGMRDLLSKFWLTAPPEMSAAAEAVQFGKFLLAAELSMPLLKEITSFEMAAAYAVMTNEPQTVEIDCDIRLAIDALVDGRRPEPPGPTLFKFILDPPARRSALS
jgi:uncharacterized protein (UPF0276 family)